MKELIIVAALLLPSLIASCSNNSSDTTVTYDQLEQRDNLFYEINSDMPYTGLVIQMDTSSNGKTETNYINGQIQGLKTSWYENGQKKSEVNYVDGQPHGLMHRWFENGQKNSEVNFVNGQPAQE